MRQGIRRSLAGVSVRMIALVAIASAALAGFVISPAFGGPGFLTKKAAKRTYITKKVVKKTYITKKATDQKYITKDAANTAFAPRKAETKLQVSPDNWVAASSGATIVHSSGEVALRSPAAVTDLFFNAALTTPAVLQGQPISLKSFELCYIASSSSKISRVFLYERRPTEANPGSSGTFPIDDDTDRTDIACRTYASTSPVPLDEDGLFQIVLRADYTGSGSVNVTRLTLNLTS